MKAITVRQPWASMIVRGIKRVENRTWCPNGHRGPLAIHAGLNRSELHRCDDPSYPAVDELEFGAIVGVVDLVDCLPLAEYLADRPDDPLAKGPYCWILANPRVLTPSVPYSGRQRLFDIPNRLVKSFIGR